VDNGISDDALGSNYQAELKKFIEAVNSTE